MLRAQLDDAGRAGQMLAWPISEQRKDEVGTRRGGRDVSVRVGAVVADHRHTVVPLGGRRSGAENEDDRRECDFSDTTEQEFEECVHLSEKLGAIRPEE